MAGFGGFLPAQLILSNPNYSDVSRVGPGSLNSQFLQSVAGDLLQDPVIARAAGIDPNGFGTSFNNNSFSTGDSWFSLNRQPRFGTGTTGQWNDSQSFNTFRPNGFTSWNTTGELPPHFTFGTLPHRQGNTPLDVLTNNLMSDLGISYEDILSTSQPPFWTLGTSNSNGGFRPGGETPSGTFINTDRTSSSGRGWGDPHFEDINGEDDGTDFDVHGIPGQVYNIISDQGLNFNARFDNPDNPGQKVSKPGEIPTYMTEVALEAGGRQVHWDAKGELTVDGKAPEFDEQGRYYLDENQYIEKTGDKEYKLNVNEYMIDLKNQDGRYFDFNVHMKEGADDQADGILGMTAEAGDIDITNEEAEKRAAEKYLVEDGDMFGRSIVDQQNGIGATPGFEQVFGNGGQTLQELIFNHYQQLGFTPRNTRREAPIVDETGIDTALV
ncbi:MAG: hypothetical protein SFZ03_08840 [Candidatus Melainabacteria bacterium]|nr:hypothetical protein [Candidatus Melainabacteria bacterium]